MPSPAPPHTLVTALQLGQLLRSARRKQGITQGNVGARLNLSQNRISHLESHAEELSFKQLLAWCAVLGLELNLAERGVSAQPHSSEW